MDMSTGGPRALLSVGAGAVSTIISGVLYRLSGEPLRDAVELAVVFGVLMSLFWFVWLTVQTRRATRNRR